MFNKFVNWLTKSIETIDRESILQTENKLSFTIVFLIHTVSFCFFGLTFYLANQINVRTIAVGITFLAVNLIIYNYARQHNLRAFVGSILLILLTMIPQVIMWVVLPNEISMIYRILFMLTFSIIAYFRTDILYILVVNATMISLFVYSLLTHDNDNKIIMPGQEIPIILVWVIGALISIIAIALNRFKLTHAITMAIDLMEKNQERDAQNEELIALSDTLENSFAELNTLNASLIDHQSQINHALYHDGLTGLPNRNAALKNVHKKIIENNSAPFSLAFIDIDNFKQINQVFGHSIGDTVLKNTARRLVHLSGNRELCARISGDAFSYIDITDKPLDHMQKVLENLHAPMTIDGIRLAITVSIGIVHYPTHTVTADTLLKHADTALAYAKRKRYDKIQVFKATQDKDARRKAKIVSNLKGAISFNELSLVFQPIINLNNNCCNSAEALLRWQSPTLGFVSPAEFIPVAETTGMMVEIGKWVFRQSCLHYLRIAKALSQKLSISVNASSYEIMSSEYVMFVIETIKSLVIPHNAITIEITEGTLLNLDLQTINKINILRDNGVRIAIDDVGSGYFSFEYLTKLRFDILKIDKSLIDGVLDKHSTNARLVDSLIQTIHKYDAHIVAEGVEHVEQYDYLATISCDYAQGYHMSKPLKEPDLITFIINNNDDIHEPR